MAKTLFEHLNHIFNTQRIDYFDELDESDRKTFSVYMIHRFISMNPDYLPVVNEIQQYWGQVGPREVYLFYSQFLPKKKQFNKYVKGSQDSTNYDVWVVELLCKHYQASSHEVKEMLHILYTSLEGKNKLREILESYGIESKRIKKAGL